MSFTRLYKFLSPLLLSLVLFVVMACSSDKLIPDGKYLLDKVELRSDKKDIILLFLCNMCIRRVILVGFPSSKYHLVHMLCRGKTPQGGSTVL